MTVPQPKRDEKGNVLGRFYPLQIEELFALRKLKVLTNAAYVHLALRYENPFCDRPIEIFPKEFALRWQMPESSVYEAIAKLKEINAIEIKYGKVVIEWKNNNAESTESIDMKGHSQQDSQQENQDSQQDALSGNSEFCQSAESKVSEISNKILDSQKEERIVRKDSGSSEKPIYIDRARSLDSSDLNQTTTNSVVAAEDEITSEPSSPIYQPTQDEVKAAIQEISQLSPEIKTNSTVTKYVIKFWANFPAAIEATKKAVREGNLKNPTGFFMEALKNPSEAPESSAVDMKAFPPIPTKEQKEELEAIGFVDSRMIVDSRYPVVFCCHVQDRDRKWLLWWEALGLDLHDLLRSNPNGT